MKLNKFDEFIYLLLVNANQMAYLEDATKTHSMLRHLFLVDFVHNIMNSALEGYYIPIYILSTDTLKSSSP